MSNLKANELLSQLLASGYTTMEKGKYVFTRKFYEELGSTNALVLAQSSSGLPMLPQTQQDWENQFIALISEAKVPQRLEDNRGGVYYANKFSVEGLKAFRKAIESGVNYQVLVKSVFLYYQSSVRFKKAVGNYFANGDWRTDYEALAASAVQGIDALKDHIQKETNEQRGNYKLA